MLSATFTPQTVDVYLKTKPSTCVWEGFDVYFLKMKLQSRPFYTMEPQVRCSEAKNVNLWV
jgi:hypothetical protein